jgi:hypothetical protein
MFGVRIARRRERIDRDYKDMTGELGDAMTCEPLCGLEKAIIARHIRETFPGPAWSLNYRERVYFRKSFTLVP